MQVGRHIQHAFQVPPKHQDAVTVGTGRNGPQSRAGGNNYASCGECNTCLGMTSGKLYKATRERKHMGLIITQPRSQIRNLSEDLEKMCGAGNGYGVNGGE